ncbi:MAG: YjfB family protein [Lachnospiraceae bacterium]
MNIAALSTSLATNSALSNVGYAVLGKMLDTNDVQGQNMVKMLEGAALSRSVNPNIGSNIDVIV